MHQDRTTPHHTHPMAYPILATLFGCVLSQARPAPAAAQAQEDLRRVANATVLIEATWEIRGRFRGQQSRQFVDTNGSGFLIAPQGIIITNNHVVDPEHVENEVKAQYADLARLVDFSVKRTRLKVRAFSGSKDEIRRPGNVIRAHRKEDLALMSVNFGRDMPYLRLDAPVALQRGARIAVCGFPADGVMRTLVENRGERGTVVSVSLRRVTALRRDRDDTVRLLQLDAAVVGGNSGGPVINTHGRVVGVLSSTVGGSVNFAIAADTILDFAKNYIRAEDRPDTTPRTAPAGGGEDAPPAPAPHGEVTVYLLGGGKEQGILKRETADTITLKLQGLGTMTYRRDEISRIERHAE